MAELSSLTVSLQDSFSAGATAVAQAADKMAASFDKVAGSNTTTDTALRTRGQTLDNITNKIDGAAKAMAALQTIEQRYQAQVQVLTQGMQAQGRSASEIADAIARLGVLRDQDASKARAQGEAIEQRFAPAAAVTDRLANSTRGGAMALRDMAMQGQDLFVQLASGGNVMTALIQQGSQVAQQMMAAGQGFGALKSAASLAFGAIISPLGLLATGVTAAVGSIAALTSAGNTQLGMLANVQQGLRGTQANYEAMGQTVVDVAKKVSQTSGLGLTEALEVAKTLANNRYFAGTATDLERLARLANDLGTQMGGTAADGAKLLGEAMRDPTKFAQEQAANFNQLSDTLRQEISLAQKGADANGAFVKVVSALETATGGAARNGLSPIARAWQDLGNAFTGGTSGWKPFMDWLANDAAATIRNFTDLIRGLGDTWRALRSGLSQEQGIIPMPGMPGGGSGQTAAPVPPTLNYTGTGGLVTRETNGIRYTVAAEFANQMDGFLRELAGSGYAISSVQGFNDRNIAGTNTKSYHAFGAAFDINPAQNPVNGGTNMPANISEMAARYGLGWGGAWTGGKTDPMHFSFARDEGGAYNISRAGPIPALASSAAAPTPAMVDSAKALNDELAKQAENTRNIINLGLDKQIATTDAEMKKEAATVGTDSDRYRSLSQILDEQKAKRFANVDASVAAQRQAESGLRATQGLTAADQALSAAMEARRQVSLQSRGEDLSAADAAQTRTNVLAAQTQEYDRLTHKLTEQTANQAGMASAYKQGNQAVVEATAMQQAYTTAVELFGQNIPAGKFQELVDFYKKLAENTAIAQTAQQNLAANDNLSFIQAQTATLGLNEDARNRLLAVMKAEQEMHRRFGDILPQEAKDYIALAASTVDATAAFTLQQNSLKELTGFFDNAFNTISSAITQAFATGNLAALKFGDIAKSVASAVISEFAKLALVNPLKNFLFGSNDVTLSSVGGVLGNLFGSGGSSNAGLPAGEVGLTSTASGVSALEGLGLVTSLSGSSASSLASANNASTSSSGGFGGLLQAGGVVTTLAKGVDYLTGGHLVSDLTNGFKSAIGFGPGQTVGSYVSSLIGESVTPVASEAGVSSLSQLGLFQSVGGESASAVAGTANAAAVGTIGSAVNTVAEALPYIGVAISLISDLAQGNFRGAAFTAAGAAAGAAIGTFVFPVIGTAIGAAAGAVIGGLVDTFFPAHPLHPFDATAINVQDGQLAVGKTATQATAANSLGEAQNFITGVNTFMAKAGLILENGNGQLGAIGQGIAGMVGLVTDPNQLIAQLRFKNDPNDTSQFGVAKGALEGMSFPNAQALSDELAKIAGFADATAAVGIKLRSVGTNLTNIGVSGVEGINPNKTGTVTDANGNSVEYLNDLRTALTNDLPKQTWANVEALDAEINTVNQFVNGTIPGLLHPIEQTTSSIVDAVAKVDATYQQAIAQSESYGLDNARVLNDAEQQAIAIIRRAGLEQISATQTQIKDRFDVASGGGVLAAGRQTNDNFDLQAQQQRNALDKQLTDTFGDGVKAWQSYADQMNALEATLGAERLATAKQVAKQIAAAEQSILDTDNSLWARLAAANGDQQGANLLNFDVKAQQERRSFSDQLLATYGDAFASNQGYADNMLLLERTLAAERIAIAKQTVKQIAGAEQSILDADDSLWARLAAANGNQEGADLLNFDVKARQERQAFSDQLLATYGDAFAANQGYADNMTLLEQTLAAERLQIVQKYGNAVNGATAEQIKSAQGSVASLFGSLTDYLQKLQTGTNSPLSPTAQYNLAKSQFNSVAGAAAAGDATSAGKLTGFGDTFLSASRALNGSGVGYATDFNRVLDAIQSVVQAPADALTNSFLALQLQQQTASITQAQQATTDAVNALRREIMQQSRLQATQANAA